MFRCDVRTDAEAVLREEEAINPDELSVAQLRELRDKAQNYTFQTEVNRMMKLIINSLYRNKEVRHYLFIYLKSHNVHPTSMSLKAEILDI